MLHLPGRLSSQPTDRSGRQGQAMVEFALVITIVLVLMFGLIEAGRMLFMFTSVYAASREGARYGTAGGEAGGTQNYLDCTGITTAANRAGFFAGGVVTTVYDRGPSTTPIADCDTGNGDFPNPSAGLLTLGTRVSVTVTTPYSPLMPMPFFGGFDITSTTSRTIMREVDRLTGELPPPPVPCGSFTLADGPTITVSGPKGKQTSTYSVTIHNGTDHNTGILQRILYTKKGKKVDTTGVTANGVTIFTGDIPTSGATVNYQFSPGSSVVVVIFFNDVVSEADVDSEFRLNGSCAIIP